MKILNKPFFFITSFFKMSSHEERKQKVLNMKVSDLSITKYIKPEDQHRIQELEEKL